MEENKQLIANNALSGIVYLSPMAPLPKPRETCSHSRCGEVGVDAHNCLQPPTAPSPWMAPSFHPAHCPRDLHMPQCKRPKREIADFSFPALLFFGRPRSPPFRAISPTSLLSFSPQLRNLHPTFLSSQAFLNQVKPKVSQVKPSLVVK